MVLAPTVDQRHRRRPVRPGERRQPARPGRPRPDHRRDHAVDGAERRGERHEHGRQQGQGGHLHRDAPMATPSTAPGGSTPTWPPATSRAPSRPRAHRATSAGSPTATATTTGCTPTARPSTPRATSTPATPWAAIPQKDPAPGNMRNATAITAAAKGTLRRAGVVNNIYKDWGGWPSAAPINWYPEWYTGTASGPGTGRLDDHRQGRLHLRRRRVHRSQRTGAVRSRPLREDADDRRDSRARG